MLVVKKITAQLSQKQIAAKESGACGSNSNYKGA